MSDTIIRVENISKQYRLGQVGRRTISHDVNRWWHKVRGKEDPYLKIGQENDRSLKGTSEYVWALKDINFDVKRGEVVGIIGRNGAGKSTLLKILSKVTAPTKGNIKLKGRIASLLEVGTGFHPDLSGRNNVFLNGAILGMTKKEIQSKFDEIVDFAGVERYIDTPVKRYSSGMYVRLAFAVAAHLDPEILIVDEVLAVGDAEFQKKCLGKMKDVSVNDGRTVLFVSHQMGSISNLCTSAILMRNGLLAETGKTENIIASYLNIVNSKINNRFVISDSEKRGKNFYYESLQIEDKQANAVTSVGTDDEIIIGIKLFAAEVKNNAVEIALSVMDKKKNRILTIHEPLKRVFVRDESGVANFKVVLPSNFLTPGTYSFIAAIHIPHIQLYHLIEDTCMFTIIDSGSKFSDYEGTDYGVVFPNYKIEIDVETEIHSGIIQ
jgi:lipopolysaccharide transport system ATP-binding protein